MTRSEVESIVKFVRFYGKDVLDGIVKDMEGYLDYVDCSCADDLESTCWYHLSNAEQNSRITDHITRHRGIDG